MPMALCNRRWSLATPNPPHRSTNFLVFMALRSAHDHGHILNTISPRNRANFWCNGPCKHDCHTKRGFREASFKSVSRKALLHSANLYVRHWFSRAAARKEQNLAAVGSHTTLKSHLPNTAHTQARLRCASSKSVLMCHTNRLLKLARAIHIHNKTERRDMSSRRRNGGGFVQCTVRPSSAIIISIIRYFPELCAS